MSRADLLKQAEKAWLDGDLLASTRSLAARSGDSPSFVREDHFDPNNLPDSVTAEPLIFGGRLLSSHLVHLQSGIAVFDIGVPLLQNGTFMSPAFAHLKYPERYAHLFSKHAGQALSAAACSSNSISDAYITLVRPAYYHWLLDTIPHLYGASRLSHLAQVKLIAPKTMALQPWQKGLLEKAAGAFGINNLAYLPTNGTAVAARPGYSQTYMALSDRLSLLRLIAPPKDPGAQQRLLYSRRDTKDIRRLVNQEKVIGALGKKFEVIEPGSMDLDGQMRLFAEARCVVGVCGSNLANIVFCQPGTLVVEIAAGLHQPHFERIAEAAGLRFIRVEATPVDSVSYAKPGAQVREKTWQQAHGDLTIDPDVVTKAIEESL